MICWIFWTFFFWTFYLNHLSPLWGYFLWISSICRGTYGLHAYRPHQFLLNYITRSPWWLHKLSQPAKPITVSHFGPCTWQPPRLPFALALVADWYQYHGCPPCMRMVSLYKRASPPSPWLTFWLNVTQVTSRSSTGHLTQTFTRLLVYSPFTR